MAYLPPRIEIYQILKALGATLETPLLPFCIMGPAYRVRDTVHEHEEFGTDYLGIKKTIVFSAIDSTNFLLKRDGVAVDLFVFAKTTGGAVLADTEILASAWDTPLAEAELTAGINDLVTVVPFTSGTGWGLNYSGTPNFYAIIDPVGPKREVVLVTANSAPGLAAGNLTVVRGQKNTVAVSHLIAERVDFCTADPYYDAATKTIGNLNTLFMATVKEGDIIYRKIYGESDYDGEFRAYVVNVDAFNKAVSIDVDLAFATSDSGPAASSVIDTLSVNAGGDGYKVAEVLTIIQAGASLGTAAIATLADPELTVIQIKKAPDNQIILAPGSAPRFRAADTVTISGSAIPGNNGPWTVATCVGVTITVSEITLADEGAALAVLHCLDSGPVASVTLTNGGTGYSVASGLATSVAPANGSGCTVTVLSLETYGQNDFFNIFSDIVNVVGYIKPISAYENNFIPNDAIGDYQAQITSDGIILGSGYVDRLGVPITNAVVQSAYTTYTRNLNRSSRIVNIPLLITSIDDIETYLGDIRPENDLAYGVFLALSSQRAGYAIAVDSNDLAGYNAAMEKLKEINVYALVPLTYTTDVYTSLKAHVDYMSGGQLSRWRVGIISNENLAREVKNVPYCIGTTLVHGAVLNRYVFNSAQTAGAINPGDILRLEDVDTPEINGDYTVIAVDGSGPGGAIKSVDVSTTFYEVSDSFAIASIAFGPPDTVTFSASAGFVVGDIVYIDGATNVLNDGWHVVIAPIPTVSPWTYRLDTGTIAVTQAAPGGTCTKSQNITGEVFYYNSPYAIAIIAKNFAASVGDRRIWNVFPSTVVVEEPDVLSGYFAAAAFAGEVGALPGPLPFTESNVPTITKVYGSSDIMGYDHLNIVAEGGNMILYHAGIGSLPTVRDQLTTDMDNVLTQNISLVVNPDFISYTLKATLEPLKGKYNIDKDLLDTVKMSTVLVLNHFTKDIGGKRILSYTDPIVTSQQDCVVVQSELTMATPAKVIQVMLNLTV